VYKGNYPIFMSGFQTLVLMGFDGPAASMIHTLRVTPGLGSTTGNFG